MSESSFLEQLKSHQGGLVQVQAALHRPVGLGIVDRVEQLQQQRVSREFNGKIGLLMGVTTAFSGTNRRSAWVNLLIDGSIKKLLLYPGDLKFIGADDV
jgi:hypothetical protein